MQNNIQPTDSSIEGFIKKVMSKKKPKGKSMKQLIKDNNSDNQKK